MTKVLEFFTNPTVRRLLVFLIGLGFTALHKALGIELNAEDLYGVVLLVLGYIGQSALTDASKTRSDALVEASAKASPPSP